MIVFFFCDAFYSSNNSTTIEEIAKRAKPPQRPNNTYCLQYDHQVQHFIQLLHRCTTLPTPLVTSSPTLSIFLSSCCSTYCLECSIGMVLAFSVSIELVSPSARVTSAKSQQGVVVSDSVREDGTHRLDSIGMGGHVPLWPEPILCISVSLYLGWI